MHWFPTYMIRKQSRGLATYMSPFSLSWNKSCCFHAIFSGYCTWYKCSVKHYRCLYTRYWDILSSHEASGCKMHRAQKRRISRRKIWSTFPNKFCPFLPSLWVFRKSVHRYSFGIRGISTSDIIRQPSNAILSTSSCCRANNILRLRHLFACKHCLQTTWRHGTAVVVTRNLPKSASSTLIFNIFR